MSHVRKRLTSQAVRLSIPLQPDMQAGWKPYHQFRGPTANTDDFSCHVSVLVRDKSPHPPHSHPEEEILIMLAGEANLVLPELRRAGKSELRLQPGQFVYYPAHFPHTLRAVSAQPANYLMLKWLGTSGNRNGRVPFGHFEIANFFSSTDSPGFSSRPLFEGPTTCLARLRAHATTLGPGAGYEPHADRHDVAIVVLEGEVETLGERARPHDLVFYAAETPHGMRNPGVRAARYVVFEFDNGGISSLFRKVTDLQRWKKKMTKTFGLR